MAHIFVSYARKDGTVLKKVRTALEQAHQQGWIDTEGVLVGGDYRSQIDVALQSARAVVVILSRASAKSPYVTYEWSYALGAGVRVIPVLVEAADLHPRLEALQYLDLTQRGQGDPWERLVRELRRQWSVPPKPASGRVKEPELVAHFELSKGRPVKVKSSYKIWVSMRNVPKGTEKVNYEILDESFPKSERKFAVKWGTKGFADWITSYGDVFLAARGRDGGVKWRTQSTLVEALRRTYCTRVPKQIGKALAVLEAN